MAAHVTWDEETIALHDAERGTRMKIEEPKTPYHYYGAEGEDEQLGAVSPARSLSGQENQPAIEWNELQVKLEEVQDRKRSEWESSDDESDRARVRLGERDAEGKKIEKDPKFAEKRKQHYNEFERVKMWRQAHPSDDEDDDEDDAAESKANGGSAHEEKSGVATQQHARTA